LRREEAAMLAGVSVDYYTRLERGNVHGASENVLEALARALQLDEAERAHLFDLAHAANTSTAVRAPRRPARQQVRPSVQHILDSMTTTPADLRNGRLDIREPAKRGAARPAARRPAWTGASSTTLMSCSGACPRRSTWRCSSPGSCPARASRGSMAPGFSGWGEGCSDYLSLALPRL